MASYAENHFSPATLNLRHALANPQGAQLPGITCEELEARLEQFAPPRLLHNFSQIQIDPRTNGAIQPKLSINQPDDPYEQEADRVADRTLRMKEPLPHSAAPNVEPMVQRSLQPAGGNKGAPTAVGQVLRSMGQLRDTATRVFFEARFGQNLGGVRVFTDSRASFSAQQINARAYTAERDIIFGRGVVYSPRGYGQNALVLGL
jgi:Domain of unknown function (DUF4157)